jgi:hypothetical protein
MANEPEQWKPGIRKLPETYCLECGYRMDAAGAADGKDDMLAQPGDISICMKCGAVQRFADDMTMRPNTPEEAEEITNDPELLNELARYVKGVHVLRHQVN